MGRSISHLFKVIHYPYPRASVLPCPVCINMWVLPGVQIARQFYTENIQMQQQCVCLGVNFVWLHFRHEPLGQRTIYRPIQPQHWARLGDSGSWHRDWRPRAPQCLHYLVSARPGHKSQRTDTILWILNTRVLSGATEWIADVCDITSCRSDTLDSEGVSQSCHKWSPLPPLWETVGV